MRGRHDGVVTSCDVFGSDITVSRANPHVTSMSLQGSREKSISV